MGHEIGGSTQVFSMVLMKVEAHVQVSSLDRPLTGTESKFDQLNL